MRGLFVSPRVLLACEHAQARLEHNTSRTYEEVQRTQVRACQHAASAVDRLHNIEGASVMLV